MTALATLAPEFASVPDSTLPGPLQRYRDNAAKAIAGMAMPTRRTENWKYSSRHLQLDTALATPLAATGTISTDIGDAYRIVIRNGVIVADESRLPVIDGIEIVRFADLDEVNAQKIVEQLDGALDTAALQFAPLNSARLQDGLLIRLSPNARLDKPLFVLCQTLAERAGSAYPRILVDAGSHSELTLVEQHESQGDAPALVNAVTELNLAAGAQVTYVRLSLDGAMVNHIGATGVRLAANARFDSHCVGFGGPLRRHDLQMRLQEAGAECRLNGVTVTLGTQHYDNHTVIEHVAPHCNSEETYRCIAAGKSHAIFNGRILIHRDAQKSVAEMSNKNLLLSSEAEIDTKPELEIYADDVKCAHGATIGQLDAESLFYLVSRGIGRTEAGTLLSMAFINELVQQIPVESVKDAIEQRLIDFIETTFQEV